MNIYAQTASTRKAGAEMSRSLLHGFNALDDTTGWPRFTNAAVVQADDITADMSL